MTSSPSSSAALEKLHVQAQQPFGCGPVEVALPGLVFDLSSLVLYGAQAIPVQLKILLDRLYSVLTPDQVRGGRVRMMTCWASCSVSRCVTSHPMCPRVFQVGCILHTLGWCLGDYVRGYMLQVNSLLHQLLPVFGV